MTTEKILIEVSTHQVFAGGPLTARLEVGSLIGGWTLIKGEKFSDFESTSANEIAVALDINEAKELIEELSIIINAMERNEEKINDSRANV